MTDIKVSQEAAIAFLENACRNWLRVPKLSRDDVEDVRVALERFQARIEAATDWKPIETAPKDGSWILCFWPIHSVEDRICVACWDDIADEPRWRDAADHIDWTQPTHWKLLPAPPTAIRTGGQS